MKTSLLILGFFVTLSCFSQENKDKKYNDAQNMQVVLEQEAQYPGGIDALFKCFNDSLEFTEEAIKAKVHGDVVISFFVETDGSLSEIMVISKVGYGIDERIVNLLKPLKYIPSIQNGVKLRMNIILTVPIRID